MGTIRGLMIDVDGVLADFVYGWSAMANNFYGHPIQRTRERTKWSPMQDKASEKALWTAIEKSCHFWLDLPLMDGIELKDMWRLDELAQRRRLMFVTSRAGASAWQQTVNWLQRYGVEQPLVVRIPPRTTKEDVCLRYRLDVALEDAPHQIRALRGVGIYVVKMEHPYNEDVEADHTVRSLSEFLDWVS